MRVIDRKEMINTSEVIINFDLMNLFFIIILIAFIWLAVKIKMPSSFLMGSLLVTAIFTMMELPKPSLPNIMFIVAQIFIGCYLSANLEIKKMVALKKLCFFAIVSSMLLILFAFLLALVLERILSIPLSTAFLSIAPGGVTEISIIATSVGADLSIVTSYQLFRLFFILFFVPPFLKWWIQKRMNNNNLHQFGKNI